MHERKMLNAFERKAFSAQEGEAAFVRSLLALSMTSDMKYLYLMYTRLLLHPLLLQLARRLNRIYHWHCVESLFTPEKCSSIGGGRRRGQQSGCCSNLSRSACSFEFTANQGNSRTFFFSSRRARIFMKKDFSPLNKIFYFVMLAMGKQNGSRDKTSWEKLRFSDWGKFEWREVPPKVRLCDHRWGYYKVIKASFEQTISWTRQSDIIQSLF